MTFGGGDGRIDIEPIEGIAGCGFDQEERRRRDQEHEKRGDQDAANDVAQPHCYRATASVSALQSKLGACGTGVGLATRGDVASVTRGATK